MKKEWGEGDGKRSGTPAVVARFLETGRSNLVWMLALRGGLGLGPV